MEVVSIQKYIHTSPRKLRLVADMVRKLKPSQALVTLRFTNKAATDPLSKAIETALANAKQQNLAAEGLVFKSLEINESLKARRFRAGSKGRVKPYKKRMSHIKIVLSDEVEKMKAEKVKKVKKEEVAEEAK